MRTTRRHVVAVAAATLGGIFVHEAALADCSARHVYNQTGWEYEVRVQRGTCQGSENDRMRQSCPLHPGGAVILHYGNFGDLKNVATTVGIQTHTGTNFAFTVKGWGSCELDHPNDTGELVINEPVGGDITIACRGDCGKGGRNDQWMDGNPYYR